MGFNLRDDGEISCTKDQKNFFSKKKLQQIVLMVGITQQEETKHTVKSGKKISEAMFLSKLEKIGSISGGTTSDGRPLLGTTARQNIVRSGMPVYITA